MRKRRPAWQVFFLCFSFAKSSLFSKSLANIYFVFLSTPFVLTFQPIRMTLSSLLRSERKKVGQDFEWSFFTFFFFLLRKERTINFGLGLMTFLWPGLRSRRRGWSKGTKEGKRQRGTRLLQEKESIELEKFHIRFSFRSRKKAASSNKKRGRQKGIF